MFYFLFRSLGYASFFALLNLSVFLEIEKSRNIPFVSPENFREQFTIPHLDPSLTPLILSSLATRKKELLSIYYDWNMEDGEIRNPQKILDLYKKHGLVKKNATINEIESEYPNEGLFIESYGVRAIPYLVKEFRAQEDKSEIEIGYRYALNLILLNCCGKEIQKPKIPLNDLTKAKNELDKWFMKNFSSCNNPLPKSTNENISFISNTLNCPQNLLSPPFSF